MKISNVFKTIALVSKKPVAILLPVVLFFAGWWFGLPSEKHDHHGASASASNQVWTCSMHPQIRQPNPGLCPICNMDLIPLETGNSDEGLREITVSDEAAALLDLRVSPVLRAPAQVDVKMFGKIDYDERSVVTTTARMSGRIDRLFADFTGTSVSKGDAIAEIYSPEIYVAQQELIQAVQSLTTSSTPNVRKIRTDFLTAAREKLRLLELTELQIAAIEKQHKPSDHITLTAPQDGIIVKLNVKEGEYLKTGEPLFSIANLDSVWLKMEAYESDLPWLRYAQDVSFHVEAIPGKTFHGRIAFIDPQLDPKRRIVRVRVNVENKERLLKPGMFANASAQSKVALHGRVLSADLAGKWISPMHPEIVKDGPGECDICGMPLVPTEKFGFVASDQPTENPILVPASAVLRTGNRAIVYVRIPEKEEPVFEGREIVLGPKTGDYFIAYSGLDAGEMVVTKGAFKLDSELQIKARPSMMNPDSGLEERPAKRAAGQITGQWSPVLRAYGKFEQSIQQGDPASASKNLTSMHYALQRIEHSQLQPRELALWKEFYMRLDNTLTISKTRKMDRATLSAVRDQINQTGRYLGLSSKALPSISPEKSWISSLKAATSAYLQVSKALSDDKPGEAIKAAAALAGALSSIPEGDETVTLRKAVADFLKEKDVKALRRAFKPVSDSLIHLIRQHGLDYIGNVYVMHCPMALNGQGADWLSADPRVRNPYFGDAMYDCGSVTDTLSLEDSNSKIQTPTEDHSGH
ncbi:MAG: efflux RND transporter periplasmic adaptor subunit [Akkermansiaceae bacterium]|nr:efflux RND transporter periplasmic adaptor subunit [Akkermansiaceae bacterium]